MKIDTEKLYFVMQPYPNIGDFEEIFVDAKRNLGDLDDLFSGGFGAENVYGIYTDRKSALKDAEMLWEKVLKEKNMKPNKNVKERFREFVDELEMVSNKHNIAIQSIGGVYIFDVPMIISYDADETSGDLISDWKEAH